MTTTGLLAALYAPRKRSPDEDERRSSGATKTKLAVAMSMVVVGANLFVYGTARHWTTKHVLSRAESRMETALRDEGLYETVFPFPPQRDNVAVQLAIPHAGGMYYWWNEALLCWGGGVAVIVVGELVPFVREKKVGAAKG